MLSAEEQAKILALHFSEGKSARAISRELGINRKTVGVVIERRGVRLKADIGQRASRLDPFKAHIEEQLRRDPTLAATVLFHQIRRQGYAGGITQLRSYVAAARETPRPKEAFLKLRFEPGEAAQVDWGEFGDVFGTGVRIHAFVMVFCYSRQLYVEFTRAEKFEDFIRCHENAFQFFGGVPRECWYDNLASAVTERVGKLVRFNARFHAYVGHHGVTPYACNPASGNEKGRVEDGVKYLRSSFWAGRMFADFVDLNRQAREWMRETANAREHRATRRIPELVLENEERAALRPLREDTYDTDEVRSCVVSPQFRVSYDGNLYSVPWTLAGMPVTIRSTADEVRLFYRDQRIATHERRYTSGGDYEQPSHARGLVERKSGASHAQWRLEAIRAIGPSLDRYLRLLRSGERSLRHECARLLALATVYGNTAVDAAVSECLGKSLVGVENIEILLKSQARAEAREEELAPEPMVFRENRLNRPVQPSDLSRYDALLFEHTGNGVAPGSADSDSPEDPQ